MNIRNYKNSDFTMLASWWTLSNVPCPLPGMMPEESTYILEKDNKALYSICLYLTNTKELCYIENFIKNPEYKDKECSHLLVNHIFKVAKDLGYKRVICLSNNEKLKIRYQQLGGTPTLSNITSLVKEL